MKYSRPRKKFRTAAGGTGALFVLLFLAVFSFTPDIVPAAPGNVHAISTDSADIYAAHCSTCHGTDGRATTSKGKRTGATDFTSDWNRDEARGLGIIQNGKGEMPSFKKKLTSDERREVFAYVLKFRP